MTAVAWGVVVALVVGAANLWLGVENWRRQTAEPTRQAQRQLHAELRIIFESVTDEIKALRHALDSGSPIADVQQSAIGSAHDRVLKIVPRLADDVQAAWFLDAATAVWTVENRIFLLPSLYVEDPSSIPDSSRLRGKEASLRQAIADATPKLQERIGYLDSLDKG